MRKTVVLFLIAVALGAYVYFYEIKGGREREKAQEYAEKVFHIKRDSVTAITISGASEVFKFVKTSDGWEITEPVKTDADESPINMLLSTVENLKKERTIAVSDQQLAEFGLGSSGRILELTMNNGKTERITIGDETNIGSNVYSSRIDTLVYIVPSSIRRNISKNLFEWRNKKAIKLDKNRVRELKLNNTYGSFTFEKEGGDWTITAPIKAKADNSKINAMLDKLDNGRIKRVVTEDAARLSQYKLNSPETRVDLFVGTERAQQGISFSQLTDNEAYGKDDARPHIFTIDSVFLKPFKQTLFNFRDKSIVDFQDTGVDRINLLFEDTLMTFTKDTTDSWMLVSGENVKNWKIDAVVRDYKNLKAKRFVEEDPRYLMPYGLTNPRGRVEIFSGNDKLSELDVGKSRGERVYVRNPRVGSVVEIDESDLDKIFPSKGELVETNNAVVN